MSSTLLNRNYTKLFVLFFLPFVVASGCAQNDKSTIKSEATNEDAITREIPARLRNWAADSLFRRNEELIGLGSLRNGFDGKSIRIWLDIVSENYLFTVQNVNNKWEGKIYCLQYIYENKRPFRLLSINKQILHALPKNEWESVMNKLFEYRIAVLPDLKEKVVRAAVMDGESVVIEYADLKTYRLYGCDSFYDTNNDDSAVKNFKMIISLLQSEFNFPQMCNTQAQLRASR